MDDAGLVRDLEGGLRLRLIRPDDEPRLIALHERLSVQTAYQRFFNVLRRLPTNWAHVLANVDYQRRLALVIERQDVAGGELLAVGRYDTTPDGIAEVAFIVRTAARARGRDGAVVELLFERHG